MYNIENNSWAEIPMKKSDKRVWHQSGHIDNEVIVIGGLRNNITVMDQLDSVVIFWKINHPVAI